MDDWISDWNLKAAIIKNYPDTYLKMLEKLDTERELYD